MNKIIVRRSDGAYFKSSYPKIGDTHVFEGRYGGRGYYFRRVEWLPRKWWQVRGEWVETGEIWEPDPDKGEFFTMDRAKAVEELKARK